MRRFQALVCIAVAGGMAGALRPDWAFGDSSGGGSGGCCAAANKLTKNDAPDLREAAIQVYRLLIQMNSVDFAILKATSDDACSQMSCGILNKGRVKELISVASDERQRDEQAQARVETERIGWFAAGAAIASSIVALLTLIFSITANRRSRRNEQEIELIERESGRGPT
jgi:hypothetical protein